MTGFGFYRRGDLAGFISQKGNSGLVVAENCNVIKVIFVFVVAFENR